MGLQEVFSILITLTAIASYLNYSFLKLPKSIGLTVVTLILSFTIMGSGQLGWDAMTFATNLLNGIGFDETLLHGVLGFLLFAASLNVNTRELAKHKLIIALLATLSVFISTAIIGFCMYGVTLFLDMAIPLEYCLVFGALISPTDPIATLGILKTVSAPKSLEMKITGEALFNDGMGIILVMVLVEWADGRAALWTIQKVVWFFTQYALGGLLLGVLLGICARAILRTINDAGVAIILTLALVMGGYTFSEIVVEVSGAICMTVTGLIVGSSLHEGHMTQETRHRLNAFWELIDEILNAILFVWIGLEILHMSFSMDTLLAALAAIVIVISARWVSVMVPVASTNLFRNFNSNIIWLMTWGGLRGGISIALALSIPYGHNRDFIIAITYCVVLFSLGIQGLTLPMLLRRTVLKAEMAL